MNNVSQTAGFRLVQLCYVSP